MPEWLQGAPPDGAALTLEVLAVRLGLALVLGWVVAAVYRWTQTGDRPPAPNLAQTLVLLSVLIAMVTQVIGNSIARAFSLVGALAIVRFRTVVEDTRDTAFVIFAVVVGMAVGGGLLTVALVGIGVVAVAAGLARVTARRPVPLEPSYRLTVRLGAGHDAEVVLNEVFGKFVRHRQLVTTATARQGAALDLTYTVKLREGAEALAFVSELNRREGVQGVELQRT